MKELKDKKIVVTGGCGFIGSHIVDRLIKEKAKVIVVDNLITGKLENIAANMDKIQFIKGNFADSKVLDQALAGADFVNHQAALRSVPRSLEIPIDYEDINVSGTLKLFLAAKQKGVKRVVFASSSSVYGDRKDFPEKESDIPKPLSPYAATKLFCEHYGYIFSKLYGLGVVGLRYFNVFGPRQSLESEYAVVVPKFINCLLQDKQPPIYGDGKQERDFSYVEDVVEANILGLVKPNIEGEVFNVGSGSPESVNNLFKQLRKIIGKNNIEPIYESARLGDVYKTFADISKSKKLLGWQPKLSFIAGLQKTVEAFKAEK